MSILGGQETDAMVSADCQLADISEAVRHAWTATLPGPFEPTRSWEEAGGDSLASLNLLLLLERALCRKLSFDVIAPDMTAVEMARSLSTLQPVRAAPQVPTVFLVLGILGDSPRLADLRRSFGQRLRFELIELAELDHPAVILADVKATALLAAEEIQRRQPQGEILLAGFSFAGCVAFEAAHHLLAAQRAVAWIAILDTGFNAPYRWRRFLVPHRLLARWVGNSDRRRRVLLDWVRRFRPQAMAWLRIQLLMHFRKRAMNRWRPLPLPRPVPALLATSRTYGPAMPQRWSELCPGIHVVSLPGHHLDLFQSPSIELLTPAFENAVYACWADRRS